MSERLKDSKCVSLAGHNWIYNKTTTGERWTLRSNTSVYFTLEDGVYYWVSCCSPQQLPAAAHLEVVAQATIDDYLKGKRRMRG